MSYYKNKSKREKEDKNDDPMATIGTLVEVVAGAAFAAWGIYNLFTASESSSSYTNECILEANRRPRKDVKWSLPKKGWLKLNTDASCMIDSSSVSIGGVFRDDKGDWVKGFAGRIQSCAKRPHLAELWAIRYGLMIAWKSGFKRIEIETDLKTIVPFIKGEKTSRDLEVQLLVENCKSLIEKNWSVRLEHIYREANEVADYMADLGHSYDNITYFQKPPKRRVFVLLASDLQEYKDSSKKTEYKGEKKKVIYGLGV